LTISGLLCALMETVFDDFITGTSKNVDGRDKPGHDEEGSLGPGSATQHFVLRRARDTRLVVEERPQLP
jgi:hypothetical protein